MRFILCRINQVAYKNQLLKPYFHTRLIDFYKIMIF